MHKPTYPRRSLGSSSTIPHAIRLGLRNNNNDQSISKEETKLEGVLDGADPPSLRYDQSSETIRALNSSTNDNDHGATIEPFFNPIDWNLPTRLYNPFTSSTSTSDSSTSTDRVFLTCKPTALQVRIFLDDVEKTGRNYRMPDIEIVGMAFYYADRDSSLLWKWMVAREFKTEWVKFKDQVLWLYPDAFFDEPVVRTTSAIFRTVLKPPTAYNVGPKQVRDYIIGYIRILEDLSNKMGLGVSYRRWCMKFAGELPDSGISSNSPHRRNPARILVTYHGANSRTPIPTVGTTTFRTGPEDRGTKSWREELGKRVGESIPGLKDEFDCHPRVFAYLAFVVWREKWIDRAEEYIRDSGF